MATRYHDIDTPMDAPLPEANLTLAEELTSKVSEFTQVIGRHNPYSMRGLVARPMFVLRELAHRGTDCEHEKECGMTRRESLRRWTSLRTRGVASLLVIASMVVFAMPGIRGALAQVIISDRHAEVIAQGVDTIPSGQVVWRVSQGNAPIATASAKATYPLGFVFVPQGKVQVDFSGSGDRVVLQDGEALFQRAGTEQGRKGTDTTAAAYLGIELVPAAQANAGANGSQVLTASAPFPAPSGDHDINLVRDVLQGAEDGLLPGSANPIYLYVTTGDLKVETADGNHTPLNAGQGGLFTGQLKIHAGPTNGAKYLAAIIGDEVAKGAGTGGGAGTGTGTNGQNKVTPVPVATTAGPGATPVTPTDTGSLQVTVHQCPADANPPAGDFTHCKDVDAGAGAVVQDVTLGTTFPLASAPMRPAMTFNYLWDKIPVSSYTLDPKLPGSVWTLVNYGIVGPQTHTDIFDVKAGQTTFVEAFVYASAGTPAPSGSGAGMGIGQLRVTVYQCAADPSGGDTSSCMTTDAGPNATVQNVALTSAFLVQLAPARDGVAYVWATIPADDYRLDAFVDPPSTDLTYVTVAGPPPTGGTGAFAVAVGGTTDVGVYIYPATGSSMPTETPTVEPIGSPTP